MVWESVIYNLLLHALQCWVHLQAHDNKKCPLRTALHCTSGVFHKLLLKLNPLGLRYRVDMHSYAFICKSMQITHFLSTLQG